MPLLQPLKLFAQIWASFPYVCEPPSLSSSAETTPLRKPTPCQAENPVPDSVFSTYEPYCLRSSPGFLVCPLYAIYQHSG